MEPTQRHVAESLISCLASGSVGEKLQLSQAQQALKIPPQLVYICGLLGDPQAGSFTKEQTHLFQNLQSTYLKELADTHHQQQRVYQLSPSLVPVGEARAVIKIDVKEQYQKLSHEATEAADQLLSMEIMKSVKPKKKKLLRNLEQSHPPFEIVLNQSQSPVLHHDTLPIQIEIEQENQTPPKENLPKACASVEVIKPMEEDLADPNNTVEEVQEPLITHEDVDFSIENWKEVPPRRKSLKEKISKFAAQMPESRKSPTLLDGHSDGSSEAQLVDSQLDASSASRDSRESGSRNRSSKEKKSKRAAQIAETRNDTLLDASAGSELQLTDSQIEESSGSKSSREQRPRKEKKSKSVAQMQGYQDFTIADASVVETSDLQVIDSQLDQTGERSRNSQDFGPRRNSGKEKKSKNAPRIPDSPNSTLLDASAGSLSELHLAGSPLDESSERSKNSGSRKRSKKEKKSKRKGSMSDAPNSAFLDANIGEREQSELQIDSQVDVSSERRGNTHDSGPRRNGVKERKLQNTYSTLVETGESQSSHSPLDESSERSKSSRDLGPRRRSGKEKKSKRAAPMPELRSVGQNGAKEEETSEVQLGGFLAAESANSSELALGLPKNTDSNSLLVSGSGVEVSTSNGETRSDDLTSLREQIQHLELQSKQKDKLLEEQRQMHAKAVKVEKERTEERMQALQLRLYISETKLKTFEDALEQHVHAVASNLASSSPDRLRRREEEEGPSTPLFSRSFRSHKG